MREILTVFFLCGALVFFPSCGFSLIEVKYIPPAPQPRNSPANQNGGGSSSGGPIETLTAQSKKETTDGTKSLQLNGSVSESLAAVYGLTGGNCIQAVTLNGGEVVADFTDVTCPSDGSLVNPDDIEFSLYFDMATNEVYIEPTSSLGIAEIDPNPANPSARLLELCHGSYQGKCTLTVKSGKFDDLKLP